MHFLFFQWFIYPLDPLSNVYNEDYFRANIRLGGENDAKCLTVGPEDIHRSGSDRHKSLHLWIWDCLEGLKDQQFLITNSHFSLLNTLEEEYGNIEIRELPKENLVKSFINQEKKQFKDDIQLESLIKIAENLQTHIGKSEKEIKK